MSWCLRAPNDDIYGGPPNFFSKEFITNSAATVEESGKFFVLQAWEIM